MHVVQRELLIVATGQHATPGVENHHRLRTRFDLRVQVQRDALRQLIKQQMQRFRVGVHHLFNHGEGFAAAAFNHVGRQRPRTTGEADQRHFAFQFTADSTHRVHHVPQPIFRVRDRQFVDVSLAGNRRGKAWTFSCFKIQPESHRIRDRQDIREEDRGIKFIATQRLQRDFAGQLGIFAQRHKITRFGTGSFVFR